MNRVYPSVDARKWLAILLLGYTLVTVFPYRIGANLIPNDPVAEDNTEKVRYAEWDDSRQFLNYHSSAARGWSSEMENQEAYADRAYLEYGAIDISSDDDFQSQGWPGNGTVEDPYRIENLFIDPDAYADNCIDIRNTRAHFIIRDCLLVNAQWWFRGAGVFLYNVRNGKIVNNTLADNVYGVRLIESSFNLIGNNTSTGQWAGVLFDSSYLNVILNNTVSANAFGVSLRESNVNTVSNNTLVANDFGVNVERSTVNTITNNTFIDCGMYITAFYLGELRQAQVAGNTVNGQPLLFLNNLVGETIQGPAGQIILINCSDVTVQDFVLTNCSVGILILFSNQSMVTNNTCTANSGSGIRFIYSTHNTAVNNTCISNGLYNDSLSAGISLSGSDTTIISENKCTSNQIGILLEDSNLNTITNNTCTNDWNGIFLHISMNNTLTHNSIHTNYSAILMQSAYYSIVSHNNCSSIVNDGIHIYASEHCIIEDNYCTENGEVGISILSSLENTFSRNTCTRSGMGFEMYGSDENLVEDNISSENEEYGFYIDYCAENVISYNLVEQNGFWGVYLSNRSSDNMIYSNSFIDNNGTENGFDDGSGNVFDYNFWSEYRGPDIDLNGIGDIPHPVSGAANNTDPHPLMAPIGIRPPTMFLYQLILLSVDIGTAIVLAGGLLKLRKVFRSK